MSSKMVFEILLATGATLYMVIASTLLAIALGLPLGTLLFASSKIKNRPLLNKVVASIINISRSITRMLSRSSAQSFDSPIGR